MYVGIAMIVCKYVRNRVARSAAIVLAVLAPPAVGIARVYRGMHHPLDAGAGALIGTAALLVALFAARAAAVAVERRQRRTT